MLTDTAVHSVETRTHTALSPPAPIGGDAMQLSFSSDASQERASRRLWSMAALDLWRTYRETPVSRQGYLPDLEPLFGSPSDMGQRLCVPRSKSSPCISPSSTPTTLQCSSSIAQATIQTNVAAGGGLREAVRLRAAGRRHTGSPRG